MANLGKMIKGALSKTEWVKGQKIVNFPEIKTIDQADKAKKIKSGFRYDENLEDMDRYQIEHKGKKFIVDTFYGDKKIQGFRPEIKKGAPVKALSSETAQYEGQAVRKQKPLTDAQVLEKEGFTPEQAKSAENIIKDYEPHDYDTFFADNRFKSTGQEDKYGEGVLGLQLYDQDYKKVAKFAVMPDGSAKRVYLMPNSSTMPALKGK